ncbi:PLP-dependent aminotransferase family protein [Pedobacter xixiisoli]|uniref:GntR family transcriptional regulator / MocR family aminotransferase n=1 Tax=Pedobacter xixiisoli TaxID=1476464 RepID=A0A285ZQD1_9SPHI|nr:PLP-dependent aminotransferase family protein [Pedobacter xixiisoli]SOD11857.1 GntR family transcriptional regulator / MocR family aminotransferase [Pedobacter xixiisoli]
MSSPAEIPFLSFIHLDRDTKTPIYLQLAQQLINAIQRGYLVAGIKMPGSRTLSELLKLHRKTVIAAYEDLHHQGWIAIHPNRGAYVMDNQTKINERPYDALVSLASYPSQTGYAFKQSNILDNPFEQSNCTYQFNDGTPDIRLTEIKQLSSLYSATLKRKNTLKKIDNPLYTGNYFREQLSNYLNSSRGLHISKDNLLITRSSEVSLYIIAQLLVEPNDVVVVAELGLFTANMVFQKAGANIKTIPIDEQGIDVDQLAEKLKTTKIRAVYITPHHHYPTTVSLSAQRRVQLLQLAQSHGFIIIEDDYDYDFQYEKSTIMPLASADVNGMVIYVGSFGKSLTPSFSSGFVVAPKNFINEMQKYMGILDRQGDIVMEQVLGEMIAEGDIHRHLKKSLKIYQERRNNCCALLAKHFGHQAAFNVPNGGLAVWLEWNIPVSLLQLAKVCQKKDLFIPQNILYQNRKTTAMRIGFGHLTIEEMKNSLEIISSSLVQ